MQSDTTLYFIKLYTTSTAHQRRGSPAAEQWWPGQKIKTNKTVSVSAVYFATEQNMNSSAQSNCD